MNNNEFNAIEMGFNFKVSHRSKWLLKNNVYLIKEIEGGLKTANALVNDNKAKFIKK